MKEIARKVIRRAKAAFNLTIVRQSQIVNNDLFKNENVKTPAPAPELTIPNAIGLYFSK